MKIRPNFACGLSIGIFVACHAQQSADPNDATRVEPDASAPAPPQEREAAANAPSEAGTSKGDARWDCAEAKKEMTFLDTHVSCKVDDDCTLTSSWLYPCGMPIQKSARADLATVDHAVSATCTKLGFAPPPRDCSHAVLRAGCSGGKCGNVVPMPLEDLGR